MYSYTITHTHNWPRTANLIPYNSGIQYTHTERQTPKHHHKFWVKQPIDARMFLQRPVLSKSLAEFKGQAKFIHITSAHRVGWSLFASLFQLFPFFFKEVSVPSPPTSQRTVPDDEVHPFFVAPFEWQQIIQDLQIAGVIYSLGSTNNKTPLKTVKRVSTETPTATPLPNEASCWSERSLWPAPISLPQRPQKKQIILATQHRHRRQSSKHHAGQPVHCCPDIGHEKSSPRRLQQVKNGCDETRFEIL